MNPAKKTEGNIAVIVSAMRLFIVFVCLLHIGRYAQAEARPVSVPSTLRAEQFSVTINGRHADMAHAVAKYYYLNFDLSGSAKISITAKSADYWSKGVEIQPWRLGIRPTLHGNTITFTLRRPEKISITRPGDHLARAKMIFIFANPPEINPPSPNAVGIRYFGPGDHHGNIDARNGDRIYLAPGAVIYGSLNIWGVHDVKVFGRGTIIYDGPQNPNADEGWKHLRNWHVIVMDNARNIELSGITCIVRSRTWMIQMRDSRHISFENVKVIGGSTGNANQDGMDWLGGGDTSVRDSFIRSADDVFAMYGNWDGYSEKALTTPGQDVDNITIERTVLSTSISNVVRVGWPKKVFNSSNFIVRDSDVIHMGMGACGIPFALFEIWANPAGRGIHSGYLFDNIRLEDWYSLVQLTQPHPAIRNVQFKNIWAIETPSMAPSTLSGEVSSVTLDHVKLGGKLAASDADVPLEIRNGAEPLLYQTSSSRVNAVFSYSSGQIVPHKAITFDASKSSTRHGELASYRWSFGDGTSGEGPIVRHAFPDAMGTLWDGSGRFRVLLTVTDQKGSFDSAYQPVVVSTSLQASLAAAKSAPGLVFHYYEGTWKGLPNFSSLAIKSSGITDSLSSSSETHTQPFGMVFEGYIDVPADGGYTFTVLARDGSRLQIDSKTIAESAFPQHNVCGSVGNAVQSVTGSIGLKAGQHRIRASMTHTAGSNRFAVLWQGPGIPLSQIPKQLLAHDVSTAPDQADTATSSSFGVLHQLSIRSRINRGDDRQRAEHLVSHR